MSAQPKVTSLRLILPMRALMVAVTVFALSVVLSGLPLLACPLLYSTSASSRHPCCPPSSQQPRCPLSSSLEHCPYYVTDAKLGSVESKTNGAALPVSLISLGTVALVPILWQTSQDRLPGSTSLSLRHRVLRI